MISTMALLWPRSFNDMAGSRIRYLECEVTPCASL
jgi:hypothetical protein